MWSALVETVEKETECKTRREMGYIQVRHLSLNPQQNHNSLLSHMPWRNLEPKTAGDREPGCLLDGHECSKWIRQAWCLTVQVYCVS